MRLATIAACGALLTACTQPGDVVNEAASANDIQESDERARPAVPAESAGNTAVDSAVNDASEAKVSACLIQDGEELRITPVKAIGTEPFWGARVEGRCVTYSTPEDQSGTRIWTRFNPGPDGGVWVGTFQGKPFELITRLRPNCSDGMSDHIYPQEALLTVGGEERRGCAAPE
jgi:uncharacterized membrane protein